MVQSERQRAQHENKDKDRERELLVEAGVALAATLDADEMLTRLTRLLVRHLADLCIIELADRRGGARRRRVLHRDPTKTPLCETFARGLVDRPGEQSRFSPTGADEPRLVAEVAAADLPAMARDPEQLRAVRQLAPRSLILVPLAAHGAALGSLILVSAGTSPPFGERELLLTLEIASRAALAFENARLYQDSWGATQDLREANEQLVKATIRAQELAEEADEAKARAEEGERALAEAGQLREMFIGILGHDLRNPLAAVSMLAASLLRRGRLDGDDRHKVERIGITATRMTRMISQLLDLTRARFGRGFPLEPAAADLSEICRGVSDELGAGIRLETEGDTSGTWDADRLAEALSNIAGNAVEHATTGTTVVIRARADGPEVVVEVVNEGRPIPAHVLPFIFEPFRRAEQGQKSKGGNLGLGLYIAKQIAEASGGTLAASSARGTTTFVMRVPRQPRAALVETGSVASA